MRVCRASFAIQLGACDCSRCSHLYNRVITRAYYDNVRLSDTCFLYARSHHNDPFLCLVVYDGYEFAASCARATTGISLNEHKNNEAKATKHRTVPSYVRCALPGHAIPRLHLGVSDSIPKPELLSGVHHPSFAP